MKIFHTADWHLGKTIYNVPMTREDQPCWIEELLKAVDREQPEALIIAGDVYDHRTPSLEAVRIMGHFLAEMAKRDKYVFIVPGNHDSDIRLAFGAEIFKSKKIYVAGELKNQLENVTVRNGDEEVIFWLMPYVFPGLAGKVFGQEFNGFDAAVRGVLSAQEIDRSKCNLLIAHQNVLNGGEKPKHSDSETFIGGSGEVDVSAFEAFDYVALGHIHNLQKIGQDTVRYAGCPLYYDFSEINRKKAVTVIETNGKNITTSELEIPLLHIMMRVKGTLSELLEKGKNIADKEKTYFQLTVTDHGVPSDAKEQLQAVYGENNILNIKQDFSGREFISKRENAERKNIKELTLAEQFADFYSAVKNDVLDGVQIDILKKITEQQENKGEYYSAGTAVSEEENKDLAEMIIKQLAEVEK